MIQEETARKLAKKFFIKHGHEKLADLLNTGTICTDDVFEHVVRSLGKARCRALYFVLPKKLRLFFLTKLEGFNEERLNDDLWHVEDEFYNISVSDRPERMKDFDLWIDRLEKVVLNYFRR